MDVSREDVHTPSDCSGGNASEAAITKTVEELVSHVAPWPLKELCKSGRLFVLAPAPFFGAKHC